LGTPQADKVELVNAWFAHIKSILIKLDSVIDADPEKDTAEKENLLDALGVCGGGWQAQFEQMQSKLITYPKGADFDAIVGKILTDKVLEIVDSINRDYALVQNKYPDVHDQNKIKYLLKEYIGEKVLDDHLSYLT
jgi:hypothetical protein